jgi:UDP-N-acetylglucosamine acyltransferase
MIHPTAIIHSGAQIDPSATVGPFCVIDEHVVLGPGCSLAPYVHLTGHLTVGANNRFFSGCVIGEAPQDLKYGDAPTRLRIGDGNVFRENVTIHRSNKMEEDTVIGSNNMFMAGSHAGHNVVVGNSVIVANGALLAGHVTVGDRAFISGNCLAHQFVRIGTLAMVQGGAKVSLDVPPYTIAAETNEICGLNIVGLRRAGFTSEQRMELKRLYHELFLSNMNFGEALQRVRGESWGEASRVVLDFVAASHRGTCQHRKSLWNRGNPTTGLE